MVTAKIKLTRLIDSRHSGHYLEPYREKKSFNFGELLAQPWLIFIQLLNYSPTAQLGV
jgi:hypothetical protein